MWFLRRSSKEDSGKQDKWQILGFDGDLSESLFEMAMEMDAASDAVFYYWHFYYDVIIGM